MHWLKCGKMKCLNYSALGALLKPQLMTVLWDDLLKSINLTSKAMQQVQMYICTVPILYNSLVQFVLQARNVFEAYEGEAKTYAATEEYAAEEVA